MAIDSRSLEGFSDGAWFIRIGGDRGSWGASEGLTQTYSVRAPRALVELVSRSDNLSRLIDAIGREQYEIEAQRGRKMSLDEAVRYVLAAASEIEARLG